SKIGRLSHGLIYDLYKILSNLNHKNGYKRLGTTCFYCFYLQNIFYVYDAIGSMLLIKQFYRGVKIYLRNAGCVNVESDQILKLARCQFLSSTLYIKGGRGRTDRSEEHTSELQSRENLVCRLLLEKKNRKK